MRRPNPENSPKKKAATKKRPNARKQLDKRSIARTTDDLLQDILSIKLAVSNITESLESSVQKQADAFNAFVKKHEASRDNNKIEINVPVADVPKLMRLAVDLKIAASSNLLTYRGLFLVLVSKWDAHVGDLLRWIYETRPEILNSSERSIKYSELRKIGNMKAARAKIVEEEVSAVIRESHIDQFEYMEKKLGIKLRENLTIWPKFVEVMQRRHLVAHTDGKISAQYLSVCKQNGVDLKRDSKLGKEIILEEDYLLDSCDCLTEIGFKLGQVLWRKLQPDTIRKAEKYLIDTTFEMVEGGQYGPAVNIMSFSLEKPMMFKSSDDRYRCIVNLAQAYKWSDQGDDCRRVINNEDWSALDSRYQLAVAVLRDDYKEAAAWMKSIGPDGNVRKEDYESWPLFREFRQSPEFLAAYRDVFQTDIEVRSVPEEVSSYLDAASQREAASKTILRKAKRRKTPTPRRKRNSTT